MEIVGFGVKSVGDFIFWEGGCLEGFNWSVLYNVRILSLKLEG